MIQIALAFSPECADELAAMGFTKMEVYVKSAPYNPSSPNDRGPGDGEFFAMRHIPAQFVTTTYWGRGAD